MHIWQESLSDIEMKPKPIYNQHVNLQWKQRWDETLISQCSDESVEKETTLIALND